jgi:GT2 family glycosyltransferase
MTYDLTVSIVLYKSDPEKLANTIQCLTRSTVNYKLYLIDNSPTDALRHFATGNTEYIFNNRNHGYGKAHNMAIRRSFSEAEFHLVLNPDVVFGHGALEHLLNKMRTDKSIGLISPKIFYPNGNLQYLCKLLPSPIDLFARRFLGQWKWVKKRNNQYELRETGYNEAMNIPYLSGCFMLMRNSVLQDVGLFDERIFMYIEDADLTRRIHQKYKTMFYPEVSIHHHYAKGSYSELKLMLYNIHGAIIYFFKWGWLVDPERKRINDTVLRNYLQKEK